MGTVLHFRTINQTKSRGAEQFYMAKSKVETAGKASLGCGLLSVCREATNRVTITVGIRDGVVHPPSVAPSSQRVEKEEGVGGVPPAPY
jgi:hypothetical protein